MGLPFDLDGHRKQGSIVSDYTSRSMFVPASGAGGRAREPPVTGLLVDMTRIPTYILVRRHDEFGDPFRRKNTSYEAPDRG